MGKTAFMAAIGLQTVKQQFKSQLILDAISTGRILSFDFAKVVAENAIRREEDIRSFFTRLMIYFLCRIFGGFQVNGICFEEISHFGSIPTFVAKQKGFRDWLHNSLQLSADSMMDEYIRLTNIAFGADSKVPPVFLLDEIQSLCEPTTVKSKFEDDGIVYHSFLSLLLTQLAGRHKPICIATGTNNGNIVVITEMSSIVPKIVSLPSLNKDAEYWEFWNLRTEYLNWSSNANTRILSEDHDMINSLIYASYQVPRLMLLAHNEWFAYKTTSHRTDRLAPLDIYEDNAISYYRESANLLSNAAFSANDLCHIMMCCGVNWKVMNMEDHVPGTRIQWQTLVSKAIIFPYTDNCYIFPFHLVWSARSPTTINRSGFRHAKAEILEIGGNLIPNFNIEMLYVTYSTLRMFDLYNLGICYESLFVHSLAAKYYLTKLVTKKEELLLENIYDFDPDQHSREALKHFQVNLSEGVYVPEEEAFVNSNNLPKAIIHNAKNRSAHHDIILPTKTDALAISCKASFALSIGSIATRQQQISKNDYDTVDTLVWLYLGQSKAEINYDSEVVFLDGTGCCNGLAIDILILTKKLRSQNNEINW
jgi:hypothetical protein